MGDEADRAGNGPAHPRTAVLVGLQASGKSTFYRRHLAHDHVLVSKDRFPRSARHKQRRQLRLLGEALAAGRSVPSTTPIPHRANGSR
ncbi:AAA family ATPase [Streptomyces albus]